MRLDRVTFVVSFVLHRDFGRMRERQSSNVNSQPFVITMALEIYVHIRSTHRG